RWLATCWVEPVPPVGQEAILEQFGGLCAHGDAIATTWDHIDPVTLGGKTIPSNIVPACVSCNSSKGNRNLDEWLTKTGKVINSHVIDRIILADCAP
ncbi:MAG TPA: HNH endonuclease, partial [Chloroflexota bacterium]|nr:HNH endonuclease [Chloroflexota bacterium]